MTRTRLTAILLIASACAAYAQTIPPPPPTSTAEVTIDELGYHIRYLASDELEGRGTGTKGGELAVSYLEREFKRYGLAPAGEKGYRQTFEAVTGVSMGADNTLTLSAAGARRTLLVGRDFTPYGFSAAGRASSPLVFAGYGINAPNKQYNDYASVDVKGRVVLVAKGHPESGNPHSDFDDISSVRSKALFAREAGAAALLIVNPDADGLAEFTYDNSPQGAGIMVVNITRAEALALFTRETLPAILARIDSTKIPASSVLPDVTADIQTDVSFIRKPVSNVAALLEGSDPALRGQVIVIGAHYDHLGWGQSGSLYRGKDRVIHNGADDNASGTAAMLEIAQYFAANRPRRSVLFLGFGAEEMGLLGSSHWVKNPTRPIADIAWMINIDMLGRLSDSTNKLNVQGVGTSKDFEELVKKVNESYKFDLGLIQDGQGSSDHASFYRKDLPVLFFFTGLHTDYHRPSDDADKINLPGEQRATRFIADVLRAIDGRDERPPFTKVVVKEDRRVRGFNVYVGTIPDYGNTEEGFKITGTSPGSPAEKAGLKAGDLIVQFGDTKLKNIYDYMNALGLHKPEEDVPVTVKRGGELLTLTIHLVKK